MLHKSVVFLNPGLKRIFTRLATIYQDYTIYNLAIQRECLLANSRPAGKAQKKQKIEKYARSKILTVYMYPSELNAIEKCVRLYVRCRGNGHRHYFTREDICVHISEEET